MRQMALERVQIFTIFLGRMGAFRLIISDHHATFKALSSAWRIQHGVVRLMMKLEENERQ